MSKPKAVNYNAGQVAQQAATANTAAASQTMDFNKLAGLLSQQYGLDAAKFNLSQNTMDQHNPYGDLTYTSSIDPITGAPKYSANMQLSPDQQMILDILEQNKQMAGGTATNIGANTFGQYVNAPDLVGGAASLTNQAIDKMDPAWERFMAPERAQLDTSLRNSGILPGTPAYHQMVDKLTDQQLRTKGEWATNFTPQAFNMAMTEYQNPLENFIKLMNQAGGPADLKGQLTNTPTANASGATVQGATVAPVDVAGISKTAADVAFKNQQNQNAWLNAMIGGGMNLATGAMGLPVGGGTFGGQILQGIMGTPFTGPGGWTTDVMK